MSRRPPVRPLATALRDCAPTHRGYLLALRPICPSGIVTGSCNGAHPVMLDHFANSFVFPPAVERFPGALPRCCGATAYCMVNCCVLVWIRAGLPPRIPIRSPISPRCLPALARPAPAVRLSISHAHHTDSYDGATQSGVLGRACSRSAASFGVPNAGQNGNFAGLECRCTGCTQTVC